MEGCFISLLLFIVGSAISWAITCGIVYLLCMCFSLTFDLIAATGIWLALWLLRIIFK